jgi:hypothetical protein
MNAQWMPSFAPEGYGGPVFRRGLFVAAAHQEATQIRWHLFRVHPNETLERLKDVELVQEWNAAESIDFPRAWADEMISDSDWPEAGKGG